MFPDAKQQRRLVRQGKQWNRRLKAYGAPVDWLKTALTGAPVFVEAPRL